MTDDQVFRVERKLVATRCSRISCYNFTDNPEIRFELSLYGDFVTVVPVKAVDLAVHVKDSSEIVGTEDVPMTGPDARTSGSDPNESSSKNRESNDMEMHVEAARVTVRVNDGRLLYTPAQVSKLPDSRWRRPLRRHKSGGTRRLVRFPATVGDRTVSLFPPFYPSYNF